MQHLSCNFHLFHQFLSPANRWGFFIWNDSKLSLSDAFIFSDLKNEFTFVQQNEGMNKQQFANKWGFDPESLTVFNWVQIHANRAIITIDLEADPRNHIQKIIELCDDINTYHSRKSNATPIHDRRDFEGGV